MASKQSYPCFKCRDAGYDNVMVFLDGKTADGKTVYKNEDMSPHQHKVKQQQQQQPQQGQTTSSTTIVTESTATKIINAKLDRIISLLESQQQQQK